MELNKIYNMDCLEGMRQIPDGSIDCIICDLPYGTTANSWDSVIPLDQLWEQYKRIAKQEAAIVLFGSEPFSTMLRMSNLSWYKYDWIWEKQSTTNFYQAKTQPLKSHEVISVFSNKVHKYYPQDLIKVHVKSGRKEKSGKNWHSYSGDINYIQEIGNYPRSIIKIDKEIGQKDTFHPTQKPVDLLRYLVRTYSNEGETILDNCMGSGTTAIACIKEKRNFIGFELNEEYYNKATKRIAAEQAQLTLF